ncbi:MAG: AEC family transporter [Opitutaceae bacterium]|nr:AEC family transporter [Opitutaceae bacterium]
MQLFTLLAPFFLILALGAALERGGFFGPGFMAGVNKLTYWVGLPILVWVSLTHAEHGTAETGLLLGGLVVATLISLALAWLAARLIGVRNEGVGTWVQAAFRGNLTFVGLPIVLTLPGIPRTAAVLAMAPMLLLYNGAAVAMLLASRKTEAHRMGVLIARELLRNPIILASIGGGIFYYCNWPVWEPLDLTLSLLSRMAVPLALLCIGSALVSTPIRGNRRAVFLAALFKTGISPLVGFGVARLLHLDAGETRVVLLLMACPTAAVSYTMVRQLGGDEAVAASAIVASTLLAAVALPVILMIS